MKAKPKFLALKLGLLACLSLPSARATPVDALGLGARSKALGRSATADARDYSANYDNPARLAFVERLELAFGASTTNLGLNYDSESSSLEPATGYSFGLVAPGSLAGIPITLGLAGYLPQGHLSRSETVSEDDPYWVFYEGRLQLMYTSVNLAVRPLESWSLGLGIASLATTEGGLSVRGTAVLPEFERSKYESDLEHQVDARLLAVRYPTFATAFSIGDLRASLVYREEAELDTHIDAELDAELDGTLVVIPVRYQVLIDSLKMFLPRQLSLGAAFVPGALSFTVDVAWLDWSSYRSPIGATQSSVEADPPEGVSIDLPEAPERLPTPPHFSDRIVPRLGFEYRLPLGSQVELPLRAGYVYEASPVPAQTGPTSFLDGDRHLFSAGVGSRLGGLGPLIAGGLRLDLALQWGIVAERPGTGPDPSEGQGTARHGGSVMAVSGDATLEF